MIVRVKVETIKDLYRVANGHVGNLAASLEVVPSTASCKLAGVRHAWYEDELDALVNAINEPGVVTVDRCTVVKLIGAKNIKVRGTLADKEKKRGAK